MDSGLKAIYMYEQGLGFAGCADLANEEQIKPNKIYLSNAIVVNNAFACEMFLKALLTFKGIDYKKKHSLRDLFDILPENYRKYIDETIYMRRGSDVQNIWGISHLDNISNLFVQCRYWFEQKTCSMRIESSYLHTFREVLQELCERELKITQQGGEV